MYKRCYRKMANLANLRNLPNLPNLPNFQNSKWDKNRCCNTGYDNFSTNTVYWTKYLNTHIVRSTSVEIMSWNKVIVKWNFANLANLIKLGSKFAIFSVFVIKNINNFYIYHICIVYATKAAVLIYDIVIHIRYSLCRK